MRRIPELKSGTRGSVAILDRKPNRVVYRDSETVGDPRSGHPDREARERADTLSVALAQPHRRGSDDPRLATALGWFCAAHALGAHCWRSGETYGEIVRQAKKSLGFHVHGWSPKGEGAELTDAEIENLKELALMRLKEADEALRSVLPRLPAAMERLTYDDREPSPYDAGVLVAGLVKLADKWGFLPKRFGD